MNYRVGYDGKFKEALVLDTPGPTTAVLSKVKFKRLKGPYYPAQEDIPDPRPVIFRRSTSEAGAALFWSTTIGFLRSRMKGRVRLWVVPTPAAPDRT